MKTIFFHGAKHFFESEASPTEIRKKVPDNSINFDECFMDSKKPVAHLNTTKDYVSDEAGLNNMKVAESLNEQMCRFRLHDRSMTILRLSSNKNGQEN
jgi:hypothetical protein